MVCGRPASQETCSQGTNAHVILEVSPSTMTQCAGSQASIFHTHTPGHLLRARYWFSPPTHPLLPGVHPSKDSGQCRLQGSLQHAMLAFLGDGPSAMLELLAAEVGLPCRTADGRVVLALQTCWRPAWAVL